MIIHFSLFFIKFRLLTLLLPPHFFLRVHWQTQELMLSTFFALEHVPSKINSQHRSDIALTVASNSSLPYQRDCLQNSLVC